MRRYYLIPIPTSEQITDMLTKGSRHGKSSKFISELGVVNRDLALKGIVGDHFQLFATNSSYNVGLN